MWDSLQVYFSFNDLIMSYSTVKDYRNDILEYQSSTSAVSNGIFILKMQQIAFHKKKMPLIFFHFPRGIELHKQVCVIMMLFSSTNGENMQS